MTHKCLKNAAVGDGYMINRVWLISELNIRLKIITIHSCCHHAMTYIHLLHNERSAWLILDFNSSQVFKVWLLLFFGFFFPFGSTAFIWFLFVFIDFITSSFIFSSLSSSLLRFFLKSFFCFSSICFRFWVHFDFVLFFVLACLSVSFLSLFYLSFFSL